MKGVLSNNAPVKEFERNLALVSAASAAVIAFTVMSAAAAAGEPVEIDIPAQDLSSALNAFGRQTRTEIAFSPSAVEGKKLAESVQGEYESDVALDKVLSGTGLEHRLSEANVIIVSDPSGKFAEAESRDSSFRVAPLDQEDPGAVEEVEDREEEASWRDVVVVTGTRIRGVEPAAPSIMFDRESFDQAGINSVEQLFDNLPQNLGEISPSGGLATGVSRIAGSNSEDVHGVSLRGLGPQSTLVLVNGRRYPAGLSGRVVDISTIPLSAVERVEIVTGGNSAVYGSDAVAGVVNVITRRSFNGVDTQAYYGLAKEGGERLQASIVTGVERDSGGFVATYAFARNWPLDATDAGAATSALFTPVPGEFFLQPNRRRHSGFLSGHYNPTDDIELYGEGLFTSNDIETRTNLSFGTTLFPAERDGKSDTGVGTAGLRIELDDDWSLDVIGTYGVRTGKRQTESILGLSHNEDTARLSQTTAVFEGRFSVNDLDVLTAIGGEVRTESFEDVTSSGTAVDPARTVSSAFGELRLPLVSSGESLGLHRVELSAAIRYDRYSDSGDTVNPQFGLIWGPYDSLTFRGTYATAFRAPALFTQTVATTSTQGFLRNRDDPLSPTGMSPVFSLLGVSDNLRPEEAETFTVGVDYEPAFLGNTRFSISYFDVHYDGRIDQPAQGADMSTFLSQEDEFAQLINRSPTEAEAQAFYSRILLSEESIVNQTGVPFDPQTRDFLDVFPNLILFNNQRTNISVEDVRGLDFQVDSTFETDIGDFSFGVNGVYYFQFDRFITPTAPPLGRLNQPGKIVDLRLRANAGWEHGPWSLSAFVNHVDDYSDPLAPPEVQIDSWTTLDLTIGCNLSEWLDGGFFEGVSATLSADNAFDEAPPFFGSNVFGLLFDPANANAIGRFISLQVRKAW